MLYVRTFKGNPLAMSSPYDPCIHGVPLSGRCPYCDGDEPENVRETSQDNPIEAVSLNCQSPLAIEHAYCDDQVVIYQAWDGHWIICTCVCHHYSDGSLTTRGIEVADQILTMRADSVLRRGLPPRTSGFIDSVLELREIMDEYGLRAGKERENI